MTDIHADEIITKSYFWFSKTGSKYTRECIEYEALKLTNSASVVLTEMQVAPKQDNSGFAYTVVATGTKQKLLLLKFMMDAWYNAARFQPKYETEK